MAFNEYESNVLGGYRIAQNFDECVTNLERKDALFNFRRALLEFELIGFDPDSARFAHSSGELRLGAVHSMTTAGQRLMTAIGMWVANLQRVAAV